MINPFFMGTRRRSQNGKEKQKGDQGDEEIFPRKNFSRHTIPSEIFSLHFSDSKITGRPMNCNMILFFRELIDGRCIGCGLCASACPTEALTMVARSGMEAPPEEFLQDTPQKIEAERRATHLEAKGASK